MNAKNLFPFILLMLSVTGFAQNSQLAKRLYDQGVADTLAERDSIAAIHFSQSATEELKSPKPDYDFATQSMTLAGDRTFVKVKNYQLAEKYYYKALDISHRASTTQLTFNILQTLGTLYSNSKDTYQVFKFPTSAKQETLEAYFPIIIKPEKNKDGNLVIAFSGGSNDGVYEGAEGRMEGKYTEQYKERSNVKLGKLKITKVYPNFSFATIELAKDNDPYYAVYLDDMAAVPIRFPKKIQKDIFLEVSLLNIRFVDNSRYWIAHPRMLMYYGSEQIENDVYAYMKHEVLEIYDLYHTDSNPAYHQLITSGRFKGKSLMDALRDTRTKDLKDFLGFVRSFPGKYMGGIWKISEVYATWVLNNAPPGSTEAMESLIAFKEDKTAFANYLADNAKEIKTYFFTAWMVDAQNMAYAKNFEPAFQWNGILQQLSKVYNNDSLLAWSYFNCGLIHSEQEKDSSAIYYYKKARPLFSKFNDIIGESYCINNIGSRLEADYKYKEAESYYQDAVQLRLHVFSKDTSDDVKLDLARGYWGLGYSLYKQSKYKESIIQYQKAIYYLIDIPTIKAKGVLATMYSNAGKSYEDMGEFSDAAGYYEHEAGIQKALGDKQAMANAYDNKGYLLSKMGESRLAYYAYLQGYQLHLETDHLNDAGFSMSNIGQMLWTIGKYDSAIEAHQTAISLRKKSGNIKGQAYSWRKI